VSGINILFFLPETIIVSPRSKSLFYVRVGNPEIKIRYIYLKLKIAHGIYLGDTIAFIQYDTFLFKAVKKKSTP